MSELLELRDCLLVIWYHQGLAQVLACGRLNVCSISDSPNGWVNKTGMNVLMLAGESIVSVHYFCNCNPPPHFMILFYIILKVSYFTLYQ